MKIIYSGQYQEIEGKSIFLAGCTARPGQDVQWRRKAIEYFEHYGFEGTLILPEPEGEIWPDYMNVVEWENEYLKKADIILFWIPRNIDKGIYGFTSNVEFGRYLDSGKIVYGRPETSDNNRYLDYWYHKIYNNEPYNDLESLVHGTMNKLENISHD